MIEKMGQVSAVRYMMEKTGDKYFNLLRILYSHGVHPDENGLYDVNECLSAYNKYQQTIQLEKMNRDQIFNLISQTPQTAYQYSLIEAHLELPLTLVEENAIWFHCGMDSHFLTANQYYFTDKCDIDLWDKKAINLNLVSEAILGFVQETERPVTHKELISIGKHANGKAIIAFISEDGQNVECLESGYFYTEPHEYFAYISLDVVGENRKLYWETVSEDLGDLGKKILSSFDFKNSKGNANILLTCFDGLKDEFLTDSTLNKDEVRLLNFKIYKTEVTDDWKKK